MSKNEEDHIADLKETFANLREVGVDRRCSAVLRGVSYEGRLIGGGVRN